MESRSARGRAGTAGPVRKGLAGFAGLALAAGALVSTGAIGAAPAYAAPGDRFPAADPLVFVAQNIPTGLFKAVTDSSGTVSFEAEGPTSPITYNSIAYNTANGFLYGMVGTGNAAFPSNSLIRIGQGGVITRIGAATYPASNAGAFGGDGLYYVTSSAAGYRTLTAINLTTGAVARTVTMSQAPLSADITFAGGYFWGQVASSTASQIVRINPVNGAVNFYPAPFFTNGNTDFAGAAWTFGNGNLGFSPGDPLATTGASIAWGLGLVGATLLALGGVLVMRRRRTA